MTFQARTREASAARGVDASMQYDAFVSYSHADRPVAAGIQKGLQRIARKMGRLNALRVFRDDTDLTATPDLFGRLTGAMDGSRYLVVVLSPHAAASEWVNKEVSHWLEGRGADRMLIVLTEGTLDWDEANGCLNPVTSSAAVPALLQPGVLPVEPLWIDVSADSPWDLRSAAFRDKVTDLAAPIHGKPKYELASDDVREQKRFRRWRRAAVAGLALLTLLAVLAAVIALGQRQEADRQRQSALSAQGRAEAAQKAAEAAQATAEAQRNEAVAQTLASAAQDTKDANAPLGLALAAESASATQHPSRQALAALVDARIAFSGQPAHQVGDPWQATDSPVSDVAISPDGRYVAGASDTGVRVWDAVSGSEVTRIATVDPAADSAGSDGIASVDFSSNGQLLVTESVGGAVQAWSIPSGEPVGEVLRAETADVTWPVAFRPGTRVVAHPMSRPSGAIGLADVETGASLGPTFDCRAAFVFSGNGASLACPKGAQITVFDATSGDRQGSVDLGDKVALTAFALNPDGRVIATSTGVNDVQLWDVTTGRAKGRLIKPAVGDVTALAFSPDGSALAVAGDGGGIEVWDAETSSRIGAPLQGHTARVNSLSFAADGTMLASGGDDRAVRLWTTTGIAPLERRFPRPKGDVVAAELPGSGSTIVSAALDGTVHTWDLASGQSVASAVVLDGLGEGPAGVVVGGECIVALGGQPSCSKAGEPIPTAAPRMGSPRFSPDGLRLAAVGDDDVVRVWNTRTGQVKSESGDPATGDLQSLAFSADGRVVATGGSDGIDLWNGLSGAHVAARVGGITDQVDSVSFAPDGSAIAAGMDDGTVRLRALADSTSVSVDLTGLNSPVRAVAFSADGSLVAAGSEEGDLGLWESSTGKALVAPFTAHVNGVDDIAFAPAAALFASIGEDQLLRFWDAESGQEIGRPLKVGTTSAPTLRFSRDGKHLVVSGVDSTVATVETPWDVQRACELAAPYVARNQLTTFLPTGWNVKGCALKS